eukprot:9494752-Pyramimonas_sp.AAC.2
MWASRGLGASQGVLEPPGADWEAALACLVKSCLVLSRLDLSHCLGPRTRDYHHVSEVSVDADQMG